MNVRLGLYCASVIAVLLLANAASAVIVSSDWSDESSYGAYGSGSGGTTESTAHAEADGINYNCWGCGQGGEEYYTTVAGYFSCSISFDGSVWALLDPGTASGYGVAFAEGNADFPGSWRDGHFYINAYDD